MKDINNIVSNENCWNHIGVWRTGNDKCDKLSQVQHCRNCEVFAKSARIIFNQKASDHYRQECSRSYAQPKQNKNIRELQLVIFSLGLEWYAIPTKFCNEISTIKSKHRLPHQKNPLVLGIVNVHGNIQLCFSLAHVLNVNSSSKFGDLTNIESYQNYIEIVHNMQNYLFAIQEVDNVSRICYSDLKQAPAILNSESQQKIQGIFPNQNRNIALLNTDYVLQEIEEMIRG